MKIIWHLFYVVLIASLGLVIALEAQALIARPVRVVVGLPADFPARIRRVAPELSLEGFVRVATESELRGLEGTLHVGGKP